MYSFKRVHLVCRRRKIRVYKCADGTQKTMKNSIVCFLCRTCIYIFWWQIKLNVVKINVFFVWERSNSKICLLKTFEKYHRCDKSIKVDLTNLTILVVIENREIVKSGKSGENVSKIVNLLLHQLSKEVRHELTTSLRYL